MEIGLILCFACVGSPDDFGARRVEGPCVPFATTRSFVLTAIPDLVSREDVDAVAGDNLDGVVSTESSGCFIPDQFDPDRRLQGVDNQLAFLKPTLDTFVRGGTDATIPESATMLDIEIAPRVDPDQRGCVDVTMRTSSSIHEGIGWVDADGRVHAALAGTWAPTNLLGGEETWRIEGVRLLIDRDLEQLVVAGRQSIDAWLDVFEFLRDFVGIVELEPVLESVADLEPDEYEICRSISLGLLAAPL